MVRWNHVITHQKVMKAASLNSTKIGKQFEALAYSNLKRKFDSNKRKMMGDFRNHAVTLELDDGPYANSRFIQGIDGNLFSFIGFHAGDNPTEPIEEVLMEETKLTRHPQSTTLKNNVVNYKFTFSSPYANDVYRETPFPDQWSPGSWVKALEKGTLSNISNYIFRRNKPFENSRSGPAVQLKKSLGGAGSMPGSISYVSDVIREFIQRMKS